MRTTTDGDSSQRPARRQFVAAAAGIAVASAFGLARPARADELPPLSEADATAQALGYREDSALVDAAKYPSHKAAQQCASCNFYKGGGGYAPCQLFPGKSVRATGWCSAFAAKA